MSSARPSPTDAWAKKKPLEVIVVGGSIAGLMHGIVLKRLGHNVRILERSPSDLLDGQGAGISAMEKVQEFLSKHDLSDQPNFVPSAQVQFLDQAAKLTKAWNVPLSMTSWNTLYYRLRANFDGLASDYVPQAHDLLRDEDGRVIYEHGMKVTGMQENTDIMVVSFENADGQTGSYQADLVIAADGPSSTVRTLLYPDVGRKYVGYIAWRGTVLEREVSEKTKQIFQTNLTYFIHKGATILLYTIPGENGSIESGERLLNYVWYCNYAEGSQEHTEVMTDNEDQLHRYSVPIGKVREENWSKLQAYAKRILPPPFLELVEKTRQPFIQSITDIEIARPCHFGGKVLLVGDALSTFRPHVGSSTNQCAIHALLLEKVMIGEMTQQQWEQQCMDYARITSLMSVAWGNKNQFGLGTFIISVIQLLWVRLRLILRTSWNILPTLGV